MKVFNIIFIVLFVVSAALQYNDPDPYLWMPIYLYAALLCLLATQKLYFSLTYYIGLTAYLAFAIYKVFDANGVINWATVHGHESLVQSMKAQKPWIEQAREFFGLVICWLVLLVNWVYYQRKRRYRMPKNRFS